MARQLEITPDLLIRAYAAGVFPMAESRGRAKIFWVDPDWRGVIPLDGLHVGRSLRKKIRRKQFDMRCDTAFREMVRLCGEPAPDRPDTWINAEIEAAYTELFRHGFAHSVECWLDDRLVGGLYGVSIGGAFFGESMVSRAPDASKIALVHLVIRLRAGGFTLLDTQFLTDHLARMGATEIPRAEYHEQLADALQIEAAFPCDVPDAEIEDYLQSVIQTS
jgi:leucyl/phenylalanyl-tRNA--protein transferase